VRGNEIALAWRFVTALSCDPDVHHRLQLFDTPESLGASVAAFLMEGYETGDNLLIIAKPRHFDAVLSALRARGCFPPDMDGQQRLVALDATDVLRHIIRNGQPDPLLFQRTVKPLLQSLAGSATLRVYAEIVELLAEEEDLAGAIALEKMWNDLAGQLKFTLMCGYSSAHFAQSHAMSWLRKVCETHTYISASTDDPLASYLLAST
jgi:MEDS: MEthanogen/methylotroph, DcmR Sensory domain